LYTNKVVFESIFSPYLIRKLCNKMPEMRFTVTKKLNKLILEVSEGLGVDKSDYVKSLILYDLKKGIKNDGKG